MANKLSLNVKKSNFVIFRPYQKRIDYEVDIKIFDYSANCLVSLERKVTVKYLGVLIDSKLSWTDHITYSSTKISKSLGILARLRHFFPTTTLLTVYRSLIQPYLSYGIAVWGQAAPTNLQKILILQKRALRLIYFKPFRFHAVPLFKLSNALPLNLLYFKTICLIMHDVFNNVTPPNISKIFTCSSQIHHHYTRFSAAGNFYIEYSRTDHKKNSFLSIGAKIWNGIADSHRALPKYKFKNFLQSRLMDILIQEDNYVGVQTLIKIFSKY